MRNRNAGFTLVELIVSIAVATIVFAAASSFMLFGMRMEKAASENAAAQNASGIMLRALESIAAEGRIGEIKLSEDETIAPGYREWKLMEAVGPGESAAWLLRFDQGQKRLLGKADAIILEDVEKASISYENNVLRCAIETVKGESYESSVYVRVGVEKITLAEIKVTEKTESYDVNYPGLKDTIVIDKVEIPEDEENARKAFLLVLLDQYGSTGKISDSSIYDGLYYSQWYKLEWGRDTPWCSIFLSWGLNKTILAAGLTSTQNLGSLVDDVMWYQFGRRETGNNIFALEDDGSGILSTSYSEAKLDSYESFGTWKNQSYEPVPGDLVFFERGDDNNRADHIGVVLYIKDGVLYTIEGNNNNRVGIFAYPYDSEKGMYMTEEMYVIGYGVIDWKGLGFVKDQESN